MDIVMWDGTMILVAVLVLGFLVVPTVFLCRMMNEKRKLYRAQVLTTLGSFKFVPDDQVAGMIAGWREKGLF